MGVNTYFSIIPENLLIGKNTYAKVAPPEKVASPYLSAAANASIRSSACSSPTERRTIPSDMPIR
jgi:hypothetical protein